MVTVKLQDDGNTARIRAGVGLAGMFVVGCFGAAMFFTSDQTRAAENAAGDTFPALEAAHSD